MSSPLSVDNPTTQEIEASKKDTVDVLKAAENKNEPAEQQEEAHSEEQPKTNGESKQEPKPDEDVVEHPSEQAADSVNESVVKPEDATGSEAVVEAVSNADATPKTKEAEPDTPVEANEGAKDEKPSETDVPSVEDSKLATQESRDDKADPESAPKTEGGPRKLPKWMCQSADDIEVEEEPEQPAVEEPTETAEGEEQDEASSSAPVRGKGRGARGRGKGRGAASATTRTPSPKKASQTANQSVTEEKEGSPSLNSRPRRSTRAKVDYANPDTATVLALIDDEELGDINMTKKGKRRGRAVSARGGRGPKKAKTVDSDEEDPDLDEAEGDGDYGKTKKTPKASSRGRGKGRPAANTPRAGVRRSGRHKKDDDADMEVDEVEKEEVSTE